MAYDFHKPSGNPGPNFPLYGKEIYGYDFATMLDNFSQYIKPDALTIIYGMYGYDWEVDDKGVSKGTAVVKTLAQIRGTILGNCKVLSCSSRRDGVSGEMVLAYYDAKGTKHEVWFEDESSVKRKESVALKMGVSQFSFWAYSFF
jgi:spore germination protein YaaH